MKKYKSISLVVIILCIVAIGIKTIMYFIEQHKLDEACSLYYGKDVVMDKPKAIELLKELAEKNNDVALLTLAEMYMSGNKYVDQDEKKALEYIEKAADSGNTDAIYKLGGLYIGGDCGVKESLSKAFLLTKKAADKGNPVALYLLGGLYESGYGCKIDLVQSENCYRQAFEKLKKDLTDAEITFGIEEKCRILGYLYDRDGNTEQSYEEAVKWYTKSAELGDESSMGILSMRYKSGRGVEINYEKAYMWEKKEYDARSLDY